MVELRLSVHIEGDLRTRVVVVSPRRPVACSLSDNDVGCNTLLPSAADFPPSLPADLMPLVAVVCELRELARSRAGRLTVSTRTPTFVMNLALLLITVYG